MGLFDKKPLIELLEQRPDQLLANYASALFLPDPTWAYEKKTGLPMMFRFSTRLGISRLLREPCAKKNRIWKRSEEKTLKK